MLCGATMEQLLPSGSKWQNTKGKSPANIGSRFLEQIHHEERLVGFNLSRADIGASQLERIPIGLNRHAL
jgi:hypothetical protein